MLLGKKTLKQLNNSVNFYYLKNNPGALHRQDTNRITNIKGLPYVSIDLEVGYLVSFTLMHHYTIIPPLIVIDHSLLHSAVLCGVKHSRPDYEIMFLWVYKLLAPSDEDTIQHRFIDGQWWFFMLWVVSCETELSISCKMWNCSVAPSIGWDKHCVTLNSLHILFATPYIAM